MMLGRFTAAVLCMNACVFAFNHPEIEWKSVATRHFRINYYDKTEPAVYAAWKIAEEAYDLLAARYGYVFVEKINLTLADYDDYSNGWAVWTKRNIAVWLPDARFELRGNTTWLRNVISHELAHIMSLEKEKGMQLLSWSFAFDYLSPSAGLSLSEPVPFMTFVPMWFAEGTAQSGSQRMDGDCWDARRDMALRLAALDNRLLTLDEMAHFTHDWIGNELVYNQGYSLVRHLEHAFGKETVSGIWTAARDRKLFGLNFESAFKDCVGVSLETVYAQWRDSVTDAAQARTPSNSRGAIIWANGTLNRLPRVSADGKYVGFLTNHRDDFRRTDLVVLPRSSKRASTRIPYARESWDFHPDGDKVLFVRARKPDRDGSYLNDVFLYSVSTRTETRLTRAARIYDIAVAPDGWTACCVQYREGAFDLAMLSLESGAVETIVAGTAGEPFQGIAYAPGTTGTVVVGRVRAGSSDLLVVDMTTGALAPLVATGAQEESPHWGADNRIYFSADYDGVFDIYSVRPDGTDLQRHTSVRGGAFAPCRTSEGSLIISEYTAAGFRITRHSPGAIPVALPASRACAFAPVPAPRGKVTIRHKEYEPDMLRPVWELASEVAIIDSADALGGVIRGTYVGDIWQDIALTAGTRLTMMRSDALSKRAMYLGAGGAIQPVLTPVDSTQAAANGRSNRVRHATRAYDLARPSYRRHANAGRPGIGPPRLFDGMQLRQNGGSLDSTAGDSSLLVLPLLVPHFGIQSRRWTPTIGLDAQAVLVMVPELVMASPYVEWHVARDVYAGITPQIMIAPVALAMSGSGLLVSCPLWVHWFRTGYHNQDLGYNRADVTELSAILSPQLTPVSTIRYDFQGTPVDTSYENHLWLMTGVEFAHGFGIRRYASLSLRTRNTIYFMGGDLTDPEGELAGGSGTYTSLSAGTEFAFPLVRNINRGRLYADNLYGAVSYDIGLYANSGFLGGPDAGRISSPSADSASAVASHTLGARVNLGFIKRYSFARRMSMGVLWEAAGNDVFVFFKMGI
ncbi:MAG: hypothetical protein GF418_01425 [Chitinivibrionales bacterium]|nr:hypothetical protein [Chitinivibrionales bacterium]MBD3394263.1 hypothetical protein [Chitinivibrionales bacterium]